MSAKTRITATLVGFVVYFILGWLLYGALLMDFFQGQSTTSVMRPEDGMIWWALILGNLFVSYLLVYILGNWAGVKTFAGGLKAGATIGLLLSLGMNLTMYGTSDMMTLTGTLVDPLVGAVMFGVTGGVIGVMLGRD